MNNDPQSDEQNIIDPQAASSDDRCVLCNQPQTNERPITNWSFRLGSVN